MSAPYTFSVVSILFRLASYVFLRIIPHTSAKFVLPTLYLAYVVLSPGVQPSSTEVQSTYVRVVAEDKEEKEKVEVDSQTTVISQRYSNPLLGFVLDLPTSSKRIRFYSFAFNTLLLGFALDLTLHSLFSPAHDVVFTRVGALNSDNAKVVVRYPRQDASEWDVQVVYRPVTTGAIGEDWKVGPVVHLNEDNDWTSTEKIVGLWPSTTYEYRLTDINSTLNFLPYPSNPLSFHTFPDTRLATGSYFRFVVTSCVMPNFPYVPGKSDSIKGFDLLADYLWPSNPAKLVAAASALDADQSAENDNQEPSTSASEIAAESDNSFVDNAITNTTASDPLNAASIPELDSETKAPAEFLLFLGDFIYADVPYYYGDDKEAYRRLYRRNYASPSFRKIYEKLPIFHIYDDHEIFNNFAGQSNDSKSPAANALSAFQLYNAAANFDSDEGEYYYDFRYGDVAFFVMDTRRHRSSLLDVIEEPPTMLGEKQNAALHAWLGKVNETTIFKFIVSSVPFTSLWQHDAQSDSWAAFAAEKQALLDAIHTIPNVIILSGDRHEFAAIEFNSPSATAYPVREFSTSPLSMFYVPFIHTLRSESERLVEKRRLSWDEDAQELKETVDWVPEEKVTKYISKGNYKWSSFEIDTRDANKPMATVEVMIDGELAHRVNIIGTPVKLQASTALGAFVPQSFKGVLDRIGLMPSKWF